MRLPQTVIITHGRFHSFDLATELQKAGRLAAIYTGNPRFTLRNTGVRPEFIRSLPWLHMLQLGLLRVPGCPRRLVDEVAWWAGQSLRVYAARTLPECSVISALSGSGLRAGAILQRRGGVYLCDRGSTHIRWAERTLAAEFDAIGLRWDGIDPRAVAVELAEYDLADAITVPSSFAMRSFVEMGVPAAKLRVVPYGVNLAAFHRCAQRAPHFRVLFVGQLSVRKGLHYLLEAFDRARLPGAELVLVGGRTADTETILGRGPLKNVTVAGALSRDEVAREMSRASVMVLPSIEEGLALVQAQALACGCPVIATTNTGSEDLFDDGREGFVVPPRDVEALVDRLTRLYRDRALLEAMAQAAVRRVEALGGWDAYGRAMIAVFDELLAAKRSTLAGRP